MNFNELFNKPTPLELLQVSLAQIGLESNDIEEQRVLLAITKIIDKLIDTYEKDYIEAFTKDLKKQLKKEILETIKKDFHFIPKVNLN
jgi:hypothetical protein